MTTTAVRYRIRNPRINSTLAAIDVTVIGHDMQWVSFLDADDYMVKALYSTIAHAAEEARLALMRHDDVDFARAVFFAHAAP
jgi:hypothetical protein